MSQTRLILVAVFLAASLGGCQFQKAGPTTPVGSQFRAGLGAVAPDFTLVDQTGVARSLSDYRGNVVLIDLSTMWCSFCQKEAEQGDAMYRQYHERGFVILTVLWADYNGAPMTLQTTKSWADFYGLSFPVLADVNEAVWRAYSEAPDMPLNLIIDRNRIIRYRVAGYNETELRQTIESLL